MVARYIPRKPKPQPEIAAPVKIEPALRRVTVEVIRGDKREVSTFESKLTAVGFGFLVPFFFITSGIDFDLNALTSSVGAMLKLPMFLTLFLVVRGLPAMLLYRGVLGARDRVALAFLCATQLPLVVAITTIATQTGHMRASTSAALVGAAILSTLIFPFVGMALRRSVSVAGQAEPALSSG